MKRILSVILSAVMAVLLISGCQNDAGRASQSNRAGQQTEAGGSVVVVMDPSSEPEAGFDPAYGWGACLLYTSPSPRDSTSARMPSSA